MCHLGHLGLSINEMKSSRANSYGHFLRGTCKSPLRRYAQRGTGRSSDTGQSQSEDSCTGWVFSAPVKTSGQLITSFWKCASLALCSEAFILTHVSVTSQEKGLADYTPDPLGILSQHTAPRL